MWVCLPKPDYLSWRINLFQAEREVIKMSCPLQVIIQKCWMSQLPESSLNRWGLENNRVGIVSKCWVKAHLWSAELSLKRITFKNHHCHQTALLIRPFWVVQKHLGIKINKQTSWPGFGNLLRIRSNLFNIIYHSSPFQNPSHQSDLGGYPLTE